MGVTKEHKHDWKLLGYNRRIPQFPGHIAKKVSFCARPGCGATTMSGISPDPDYVPSRSGTPREVLQWIDAKGII